MTKLFKELEISLQETILPALRSFYDQISIETCDKWLMQIWYGDKSIFESFETYELDPFQQEEAFEEKKMRLFSDGVYLYYIHSNDKIELICDAYNQDYYKYR